MDRWCFPVMWGSLRFPRITKGTVSTAQRIHTEPDCLEASHKGKRVISTVLTRLSQKCGCSKNRKDYKKCCTWVPSSSPNNSQCICDQQCWPQNERESVNFTFIIICYKAEHSLRERGGIWIQLAILAKPLFSSSFCPHAMLSDWVTFPYMYSYSNHASFCTGSALSSGLLEKV